MESIKNFVTKRPFLKRLISEWATYFTIAISLSIGIFAARFIIFFWHPVVVSGQSMYPTYSNGEVLITTVDFNIDDISVGDVVTFRNENLHDGRESIIKRVVALPGDTLYIKDGLLYVNGKVDEKLQYDNMEFLGCLKEELTLKENEFFCLGDNRNFSTDSRFIGPVKFDEIENIITRRLFKED